MAPKSTELGDTLLRLAVHGLRGPLTSILVNLDLLLADVGPLSEDQRASAAGIGDALAHMNELITGLLEYDRLMSPATLEIEPCELNALVRQITTDFRTTATAAGHELVVVTDAQPLVVNGDAFLLRELVANLLSNAIKFTPAGGRIEVRTARQDGQAVLTVRDTGPGVDPAYLERVFEPFYRASGAQAVPGSGLGLSLVKVIAERHGGHVRIENADGGGCLVTVHLPRQ